MNNKNAKSPREKTKLVIIAACFIVGLIFTLAITSWRRTANETLPKNAVLQLTSDRKSIAPGEDITVSLILDSLDTEVAAAEFVIDYDGNYLQATDVSTGNYFETYPIKDIFDGYVKISAVASFDGENLIIPKGRETVGLITFRAGNKTGNTGIKVNLNKTVIANSGQNILDNKEIPELSIEIK